MGSGWPGGCFFCKICRTVSVGEFPVDMYDVVKMKDTSLCLLSDQSKGSFDFSLENERVMCSSDWWDMTLGSVVSRLFDLLEQVGPYCLLPMFLTDAQDRWHDLMCDGTSAEAALA